MGRGQLEGSDYYVRGGGGGRIEDTFPNPFCPSCPLSPYHDGGLRWGALNLIKAPHSPSIIRCSPWGAGQKGVGEGSSILPPPPPLT